jgi:hypothetical protein
MAGFADRRHRGFYRFPAQKVYAGSVYHKPDGPQGGLPTRNLGTTTTGLSEDTGTVLWRDAGSTVGCVGTLDLAANPDNPDSPTRRGTSRCAWPRMLAWQFERCSRPLQGSESPTHFHERLLDEAGSD